MSSRGTTLSPEFIERQRKRLEALHAQLLGGEALAPAKQQASRTEHADEAEEFEEKAQDLADDEVRQALHDVDDRRVSAIERALQKIAEGTYGLSDLSGKPIPKTRLDATPEAILTVEEERQQEQGINRK